jgi:hypothetical protein
MNFEIPLSRAVCTPDITSRRLVQSSSENDKHIGANQQEHSGQNRHGGQAITDSA